MRARSGSLARPVRTSLLVCSACRRSSLAGIGMLERKRFQVAGFQVLADAAAAQHVPAVIARDFIKPRGKGPRRIVGPEFLAHFHEYFRGRVLCIFAGRKQPAGKTGKSPERTGDTARPRRRNRPPGPGTAPRQFRVAHRLRSSSVCPLVDTQGCSSNISQLSHIRRTCLAAQMPLASSPCLLCVLVLSVPCSVPSVV